MSVQNSDLLPASTGIKLGSSSQQFDAYLRNVVISGNLQAVSGVTGGSTIIVLVSSQSGADAGTQITNAVAALPSTGGAIYVDLQSAQTIATDVFSAISKPVHFIWYSGTYALTLGATIPTTCAFTMLKGAQLNPATGKTLLINGSFQAGMYQCFGGAGTTTVRRSPYVLPQWYGAVGDGATDDYAAINACVTANPGRLISFPKTQASVSGNGQTVYDYYCSQTINLSGNAQTLDGGLDAKWSSGTAIKFAADVLGIYVSPTNCGCCIKNLEIYGQRLAGAATTADGIMIRGGETSVENVTVTGFGRHGIYIDGTVPGAGMPDLWRLDNVQVIGNRANGLFVEGQDSNAGVAIGVDARSNVAIGIEDQSLLGNTYIQCHTTSNAIPYKAVGASQRSVWLGCYSESDQAKSQFQYANLVIGGDHGAGIDYSVNPVFSAGATPGQAAGDQTQLGVWNQRDQAGAIHFRSGLTSTQQSDFMFTDYQDNNKWALRYPAPGTVGDFELFDYVANFYRMRAATSAGDASTYIRGKGTTGEVIFNAGSGGPVSFYGGGNSAVASVSAAGKGSFDAGVVIGSSGPQVVSGADSTRNAVRTAYPSVPIGSTYLSTAGKMYLKVANAAADTDWERVTTSAAD